METADNCRRLARRAFRVRLYAVISHVLADLPIVVMTMTAQDVDVEIDADDAPSAVPPEEARRAD